MALISFGAKVANIRYNVLSLSVPEFAEHANLDIRTIKNIENGETSRPNKATIRKLAKGLGMEPSELIENTTLQKNHKTINDDPIQLGIVKCSDRSDLRVSDYKKLFIEASGEIFVSGTSMISFSEDSAELLFEKVYNGSSVRLLIIDPDWIEENFYLLTFLPDDDSRRCFHLEVRNSINKLQIVHKKLPNNLKDNFVLKSYKTIFPYIITGFSDDDVEKCVVEITDFLPERNRPRFLLDAGELFEMILKKFNSLWESNITNKVF